MVEPNKIYAVVNQMGFFYPYSPILEGILNVHHDAFAYLLIILTFITFLLVRTLYLFRWNAFISPVLIHHREQMYLEVAWTLLPTVVLIFIGVGSIALLYSLEEPIEPFFTHHAVGHQWYWSYYHPAFYNSFDSCIVNELDLHMGDVRLLEVDNRFVIPVGLHGRLLISSGDVLHSWAMPSFGIKVDACPGRMNQSHLFCKLTGIYHGQCSEICGVGHAFMPIVVQSVESFSFIKYLASFKGLSFIYI
uniref:Cytochrome c oxidase subunit 2 n=1 Tax=Eukaryota sp. BB2 TaxID=1949062 RepID=A0A1X8VEX5_9EUKA|nr:cytochrome c oxidase subunit 2 [Eukaryota sp. BB2]AQL10452.1 cytochrome c oxidase subunit 2 [Eukaryota sp. BB2]